MKDYVAKVQELRQDKTVHHNCNQAILLAFQEEMGLDASQLQNLGSFFGLGMGCKYTCGAVTGGLMAMGAMGCSKAESKEVLEQFLQRYGSHSCEDLLKQRALGGASCDDLIVGMVELLQSLREEEAHGG